MKEITQDIIEGNKLIAEFMGGVFHRLDDGFGHISEVMYFLPGNNPNPHCSAGTYKNISELDYHIRWDWLMPVVEKIKELVMNNAVDIVSAKLHGNINIQLMSVDIKKVWQSVIDFIQWYNQNHQ